MAMTVLNNTAVQMTLGELNKNITQVGKNLKRLSLGEKITGAGDDSANFAISEKMRVRLRALEQDQQNVQNGSMLLNVAEGGIQQQIDILRTLREKVLDACNDTNTEVDRKTIQKEYNQFLDQIEQTAFYTEYNEQKILIGDTWIAEIASVYEELGSPTLVGGSDDLDIIPNIYPVLDGKIGPFDIFEEYGQYIAELPGIIEDYNPTLSATNFTKDDYYLPDFDYGDHALNYYAHLYGGKDGGTVSFTSSENYSGMDYGSLFPNITNSMTASQIHDELNNKTVKINGTDYVFTTDLWKDYRNDSTGRRLPTINLNNINSRAALLQTVAQMAKIPYTNSATASTVQTYQENPSWDYSVEPPTMTADYLNHLSTIQGSTSVTLSSGDWLDESNAKGTEKHDVLHYHIDEQVIYHPSVAGYSVEHTTYTSEDGVIVPVDYKNANLNGDFSGGKTGHGRTHGSFTDPDAALSNSERAHLSFDDVTLTEGATFVLNGATNAIYTFVNDSSGVTFQGKTQSANGRTSTAYFTIGLNSDFSDLSLSGGGQNVGVHLTKTKNSNGTYDLYFESDNYGEQYNSYNVRSYPAGMFDWQDAIKYSIPTINTWTETFPSVAAYEETIPAQDWDINVDYYGCSPYDDVGDFEYVLDKNVTANTLGASADEKATYVINVSDVKDEASMQKFFKDIAGKGFSYCDQQPIEFINTDDIRSMSAFRKLDIFDDIVDPSQRELMDIGGQRVVDLALVKSATADNVANGMSFSEGFSKAFADAILSASASNSSAGLSADNQLSYLYQAVDASGNPLTETDIYGRTNQPKYTVDAQNSSGLNNKIVGVKITSSKAGAAGNQDPVVGWEGTLRHYDINFGEYFKNNKYFDFPDDLYGKGFRVYCATDGDHWFNFIFSNGTDNERPEGSEDIKDIVIDVSQVKNATDLVNAIYDQATPILTGDDPNYNHMMRLAAESDEGILTVYDFRRWNIDDTEEYPDRQEKGAKIADGILDDIVKKDGYVGTEKADLFVRDLIIHHTDHDSMNIHIKIPDMRLKFLFGTYSGGRDIRDYSMNSAEDRKALLGKRNPPGGLIDQAITYALKANVMVGAQNARLHTTYDNVVVQHESTTLSETTIRDADMAKEMAAFTKNNVLTQAAQAMLAQGNQNLSSVLSLLQ